MNKQIYLKYLCIFLNNYDTKNIYLIKNINQNFKN